MRTADSVRYLEFHDAAANSHKFYRVSFHGDGTATIEWGRVSSEGQSQTKTHPEAQAKLNEKMAKGYHTMKDPRAVTPAAKIDPFAKIKRDSSHERAREVRKAFAEEVKRDDMWEELAATTERKFGS